VQIPVEEVKSALSAGIESSQEEDKFEKCMQRGRTYTSNGIALVEFHVDSLVDDDFSGLHHFIEDAEKNNNGIGANQSYFLADKSKKY
jgi:hypothetical protein